MCRKGQGMDLGPSFLKQLSRPPRSPASPEDRSWTLGLPACASPPVLGHVHIRDAFSPLLLPLGARCHHCHLYRRSRIPTHSLLHQQGTSG